MIDDVVVVGGGPSGLAAALEAVENGARVTVLERLDRPGGLCRTLTFEGCRFDIGPHRFFTRNEEVKTLFYRVLGDDVITVKRQTRILHGGTYFDYPLTPRNAMAGLGLGEGLAVAGSYAAARLRGIASSQPAETFEDWVVNRFGRRLYEQFFEAYTEKVWGIPCREIGADWAAQRIRGLSLPAALRDAVLKPKGAPVKSLIDQFSYPRLGAGQTYEKMAALISAAGGRILTGSTVKKFRHEGGRVLAILAEDVSGNLFEVEGERFLTSATLTETVAMFEPTLSGPVSEAARSLRYRDHICVNLLAAGELFPDNWIYVHDRQVDLARIANYRNFSSEMAGTTGLNPLTVEYFSSPGDALALADDSRLIRKAATELERLGLLTPEQIVGGFVVRSPKAYPLIEIGCEGHVSVVRAWLNTLENLLPIGRSGMFKYNNQDHAMATGLLASRTILGLGSFDPWKVNIDGEYHEAG